MTMQTPVIFFYHLQQPEHTKLVEFRGAEPALCTSRQLFTPEP